MGIIDSIIKNIFGTKSERDIKEILPIVQKIHEEYAKLQSLSNDELRSLSNELKNNIRSSVFEQQEKIKVLKEKVDDPELDIREKEDLYKEIEDLEKEIDKVLANKLDESLPLAFAIMKDTARRFFENEEVVVTANDFDRELAATNNHIIIKGDKAIYKNRWMAGGNEIQWDMVHYDCQLIGGIVLHQGKIAEMATGEGKTVVATLPVFLNALTGRGVHVVTVNDYLAKRDSEWMGPLFHFMDFQSIVSISISPIRKPVGKHIMLILHMGQIMSLVLIICVIIWHRLRKS